MSAKVDDVFKFEYPKEPHFNCTLTVTRVLGEAPDDLVFFNDGTHSKQKNLLDVPRYIDPKVPRS